jgi:hypothetical protein
VEQMRIERTKMVMRECFEIKKIWWVYHAKIEFALEKLAECLHNPESSLLLNEAQLFL